MLSRDQGAAEGGVDASMPGARITRAITINPGQTKTVGLGTYKTVLPEPAFDIQFSPDIQDMIGVSRDKLEDASSGKYILLYQFHNFGDQACNITVRNAHGDH